METIFDEALALFTDLEKEKIEEKIEEWFIKTAEGRRVTGNFNHELFLPVDSMEALLQCVHDNKSEDIDKLEEVYHQQCHDHTLKGGNIEPGTYPEYFGFAYEYKIFDYYLSQKYRDYWTSDDDRDEFIYNLIHGSTVRTSTGEYEYSKIKLKPYNIWSTWYHDDNSKFPFEFTNTDNAEEIRANLGLSHKEIDDAKGLLLFVYRLPSSIKPQKATIADAGLNQYFEPPRSKSYGHGFTVNWPTKNEYRDYDLRPRPECIHKSVKLKHILLPIENRT